DDESDARRRSRVTSTKKTALGFFPGRQASYGARYAQPCGLRECCRPSSSLREGKSRVRRHTGNTTQSCVPQCSLIRRTKPAEVEEVHVSLDFWTFELSVTICNHAYLRGGRV